VIEFVKKSPPLRRLEAADATRALSTRANVLTGSLQDHIETARQTIEETRHLLRRISARRSEADQDQKPGRQTD
jgi:hypothetical protein